MILLMFGLSREIKKIDPEISLIATTVPSLFDLILFTEFLCTLQAWTKVNLFAYRNKNLTIPSENPTAIILPEFFFENGNHSMHVDSLLVANFFE